MFSENRSSGLPYKMSHFFLCSLKREILLRFMKNLFFFIFLQHQNSVPLYKQWKTEILVHFIKKSKIFFIFSQNRHSSVLLKNFFIFSQNGKFSPAHFIKSVIFFYLNQNRNFLKISYIHLKQNFLNRLIFIYNRNLQKYSNYLS